MLTANVVTSVVVLGIRGAGIAWALNHRLIADEGATAASTVTYSTSNRGGRSRRRDPFGASYVGPYFRWSCRPGWGRAFWGEPRPATLLCALYHFQPSERRSTA